MLNNNCTKEYSLHIFLLGLIVRIFHYFQMIIQLYANLLYIVLFAARIL
jgi:hypothetical protein